MAVIAPPSFNPEGNVYTDTPLFISIVADSSTPNIFYTVDGSDPTPSATKYTTPIPIISTCIIKAIAVDAAGNPSIVASAAYIVRGAPADSDLASRKRLGTVLAWMLAACVGGILIPWLVVHYVFHAHLFGEFAYQQAMALTSLLCAIGALVLAVLAFFLGPMEVVLYCLLAEVIGCTIGWAVGIYISPHGYSEAHAFQQIGLTIGTLLSGVVLSKILRVIDTFLDPTKDANYGRFLLLAAYCVTGGILSCITVYVDRAYGSALEISVVETSSGSVTTGKPKTVTADNGICILPNTRVRFIPVASIPTEAGVAWSMSPKSGGYEINADDGTFTAPDTDGGGSFLTVLAVSQIDPGVFGSKRIRIGPLDPMSPGTCKGLLDTDFTAKAPNGR
jgi:Chitobiase/beta-hexosaminidase C-terminal domain